MLIPSPSDSGARPGGISGAMFLSSPSEASYFEDVVVLRRRQVNKEDRTKKEKVQKRFFNEQKEGGINCVSVGMNPGRTIENKT